MKARTKSVPQPLYTRLPSARRRLHLLFVLISTRCLPNQPRSGYLHGACRARIFLAGTNTAPMPCRTAPRLGSILFSHVPAPYRVSILVILGKLLYHFQVAWNSQCHGYLRTRFPLSRTSSPRLPQWRSAAQLPQPLFLTSPDSPDRAPSTRQGGCKIFGNFTSPGTRGCHAPGSTPRAICSMVMGP
jgi:hypothetical protein